MWVITKGSCYTNNICYLTRINISCQGEVIGESQQVKLYCSVDIDGLVAQAVSVAQGLRACGIELIGHGAG